MKFYQQLVKRFIILSTLCFSITSLAATEQTLDTIVATVNNGVITQSEVDRATQAVIENFRAAGQPAPSKSILRKKVLNQLIDKNLQLQLAHDNGLTVTTAELNQAIKNVAEQNHLTINELYRATAAQGMSKESYQNDLKEQILLQKLQQQEVGPKVSITPAEINNYIEQAEQKTPAAFTYHLKDFQIPLADEPTTIEIANAKKQAEKLISLLRQGKDTASIQHSETDLGPMSIDEIPSAFTKAVTNLAKSNYAGPIQTGNGFHIIYLLDRTAAEKSKISTDRAQQALFEEKYQKVLKQWLALIRGRATINLNPGN